MRDKFEENCTLSAYICFNVNIYYLNIYFIHKGVNLTYCFMYNMYVCINIIY